MEIDANTRSFGFVNKDAEELYNAVLVLLDAEFQNCLVTVMNPKVVGEEKAFAAGQVAAYNDALRLFQANRDFMQKARTGEKQSNAAQSGAGGVI
jgi:hypothetical protein